MKKAFILLFVFSILFIESTYSNYYDNHPVPYGIGTTWCDEDGDGVRTVALNNNPGALLPHPVNSPIPVPTSGFISCLYYDATPPTISANNTSVGATDWDNTNINITLSASDGVLSGLSGGSSYLKYRWDNSNCVSGGTTYSDGTNIQLTTEGVHTLYLCARDVAGNTQTWSGVYRLDKTAPVYNNLTQILTKATDSYDFSQSPYVSDPLCGGPCSGLDEYKIKITKASCNLDTLYQNNIDFNNIDLICIKSIAPSYGGGDGSNDLQVQMWAKDLAGNIGTSTVNLYVVASDINSSNPGFTHVGDNIADATDTYTYDFTLKDSVVGINNIVRPVKEGPTQLVQLDIDFTVNTNNFVDDSVGSLLYKTTGMLSFSPNGASPLIFSGSYLGGEGIGLGIDNGRYEVNLQSTVPTEASGYTYAVGNINFDSISFTQNFVGCGVYDCSLPNSNIGGNPIYNSAVNSSNLEFDAPLEIDLSTPWADITPGSFDDNPIDVTFVNNSTDTFTLDSFKLLFMFSNPLLFAGVDFQSSDFTFGIPASITDGANIIGFSVDVSPNNSNIGPGGGGGQIFINPEDYGQGFGDIGFMSYIVKDSGNNVINTKDSAYLTSSYGIDTSSNSYNVYVRTENPTFDGTLDNQGGLKIDVVGLRASRGDSTGEQNASGDGRYTIDIDEGNLDKLTFKTNVNKSVEQITSGLTDAQTYVYTDNSIDITSANLNSNKILYYDLSNCTGANVNGNSGCIVELDGGAGIDGNSNGKIGINGTHTIIIKGGNLYIKGDMYYADQDSLLGIIVLRNEENPKKGGNIYVDPKVTNVVGTIFAEGSVMSYNGTTINPDGELFRQLHIFGSLFSSNSIGDSYSPGGSYNCPYGSDDYLDSGQANCNLDESKKYDLVRLRNMTLTEIDSGDPCYPGFVEYGVKNPSGGNVQQYAFAGKAQCYIGDTPTEAGLRTTSLKSPVVIEYNPQIQNISLPGFTIK